MIPPDMYDFIENDKVQSAIEFGKRAVEVVAVVVNPLAISPVCIPSTGLGNGTNPFLQVNWKPKL